MKQNKVFYAIVRTVFKIFLRVYNRISITWQQKFDANGENFIVACNHASNMDPVIVGCFFPRRLRYFAKEELFKFAPFRLAIESLGAVPVSRENNASAAGALRGFMKLYEDGNDVLIFPEGGRSLDGKLQPLEAGVAVIASHTHAPILPVFIKGSFAAMPPGSALIKPKKIRVIFGEPLRFPDEVYKTKNGRNVIMAELSKRFSEFESQFEGK